MCVVIKNAGIEIYDSASSDSVCESEVKQTTILNPSILHHPLWITKIDTSLAKQLVGPNGIPISLD
jgi:hypothetical protein